MVIRLFLPIPLRAGAAADVQLQLQANILIGNGKTLSEDEHLTYTF